MVKTIHARITPSMKFKLSVVRAGFAIGGRVIPKRTIRSAARLFSTPLASSRARARAAAPDASMRRESLRVADRDIASYVWGDPSAQPYALLVHGWSSFGLRYLPWIGRLRELGYAVVSFDQPGHGHSGGKFCTLPDFIGTIRAVGQHYGRPALAVGHSLGGAALALSQDECWYADRLILVAPAADVVDATTRFFRMVRLGLHLHRPFLGLLERRTGVPVSDLQVHEHLPRLGQPGLIIHDLDDADVPWSEGERYARHWHHARLLTTEGLGHHRVLDAPEVIDASLSFIQGEPVGQRVVSSPNLPFGL
ncbi:alpha/beta hydrolase [Dyella sp.]|uniref:alpha/beta hydrolase n=1 Tax=Dyella sp. TaxID=1869338 RepID=UPI002ED14286